MLVFGSAMPTVALADVIDDLVAGAPDHAMSPTDALVDNGDGTYDVTLSVTGATEETETPKPIDIIYVVDRSLSMAPDLKAARNAITAAANKYLTAENANLPADQQIRMAVITYGRKAEVKQGFTNVASDVTKALPRTAPESGTNWEAALVAANSLSGRTGVEKRIVLLSDSGPTLRTSAEGYDGPSHPDGTYGMSVDDPKGRNYSAALRAAQNRGGALLYTVSLSSKAAEAMSDLSTAAGAEFVDGTTEAKLTAAFTDVNTTIKRSAGYRNVKLVNQLSDYAEFVTAGDGSVGNLRYVKGGTNWTYAPAATIEGNKLTWNLGDGTLEDGVTYSVTFTIRPSAKAFNEVAANGQAQDFEASVADENLIEYKSIVTTDGVTAVSDAKTSPFTESPVFNVAAPEPVHVTLTATKVLNGASLSGGEFAFELVNNNDLIASARNDAEGKITFRELALKQTGSYTFNIREVTGNVEGMTYDTSNHIVKVLVTVNDQGKLEVSVEGNNPTFTNTYVAPADKPTDKPVDPNKPGSSDASISADKQIPQTGDTNNAMLPIAFAAVAVVCIAAGVTLSRKKK